MLKIISITAMLAICGASSSTARSLISPCGTVVHLKKGNSSAILKLEKRVASLERRGGSMIRILMERDRELAAYRNSIITLSVTVTKLNARLAQLEKSH